MRRHYRYGDRRLTVDVLGTDPVKIAVSEGEQTRELALDGSLASGAGSLLVDGVYRPYCVTETGKGVWVTLAGFTFFFEKTKGRADLDEEPSTDFTAPMPGKVVKVAVAAGDKAVKGQVLAVMEAMKMEHRMEAPADGVVTAVHCREGDLVDLGFNLLEFEAGEA